MSRALFNSLAVAAMVLFSAALHAHHSEDPRSGTPIEWRGRITAVSWDGAHVMYRIDVENARHEIQNWQVLGASPKVLAARNITKSTLKRGDEVTVNGWLNVYSKIVSVERFTTADGTQYSMGFFPGEMQLPRAKP